MELVLIILEQHLNIKHKNSQWCARPAFYDALSSNKNSHYGGVYQCKRFLIYGNSELACKRQKAAQVPNPRRRICSSRQKHTQGKNTWNLFKLRPPRVQTLSSFYCREIIKAVKFQFPSGATALKYFRIVKCKILLVFVRPSARVGVRGRLLQFIEREREKEIAHTPPSPLLLSAILNPK